MIDNRVYPFNPNDRMDGQGRLYYKAVQLNKGSQSPECCAEDGREVCTAGEANLISSESVTGFHCPVIDIDLPCELIPSTTPGHFHLYIDHPVAKEDYLALIAAMAKCGLVNEFYNEMAQQRGATFVRPRWVKK